MAATKRDYCGVKGIQSEGH